MGRTDTHTALGWDTQTIQQNSTVSCGGYVRRVQYYPCECSKRRYRVSYEHHITSEKDGMEKQYNSKHRFGGKNSAGADSLEKRKQYTQYDNQYIRI